MVQPDRSQTNEIRRMYFPCWISKAADTHSEYVVFTAFTRQQSLHESSLLLHYMYTADLVSST
jgi:hypothetical protein